MSGILAGFLDGDNVTASYSRTPGNEVGKYTISATIAPSGVLDNYNITYDTAEFNITKRPLTVEADAKTKVYGSADPELTYEITSGTLVGSGTITGSLARDPGENVGTYAINQGSLTAGDNYNITFVGANFKILYAFGGFLQPINSDGSSVFKLGSTVPGKFQLKDANGIPIGTAVARIYVAKVLNQVIGDEMEAVSTSAATTGNLFRYTGDQYMFNLSTKSLSKGTWQIRAELDDGTSRTVIIGLR